MLTKLKKAIVLVAVMTFLLTSAFIITASAASVSVGGGNYTVGQSVSIRVSYNSGGSLIYTAHVDLAYNTSVLQFTSVSGAEYKTSGNTISVTDDNLTNATKNATSGSYVFNFKAIAAGTSSISVSAYGVDANLQKLSASSSSNITVKTPEPSSNANLSSITVTNATLSPGFSSNTTKYVATVKYSVDKVTIKASSVDSKANIVGAGTFDVSVGDNNRTITVTAENGTKKSYEVNVKRLTQEETAILEEQERERDPSLVIVDGVDYHIATDISDKSVFEGFTLSSAEYKGGQVPIFKDEKEKYSLYYFIADDQTVSDWFYKSKDDEFKRLNYILIANRLYIIEKPDSDLKIPDGYYSTSYELPMGKVKAFRSDDKSLDDFYILYCYLNGEHGFYIFDSKENTMQRTLTFGNDVVSVDSKSKKGNFLETFNSLNSTGKIIIVCLFAVVVLVIVLIVLIILKMKSNREDMVLPLFTENEPKKEFDQVTDLNDYVGNDGNQDNDEIF